MHMRHLESAYLGQNEWWKYVLLIIISLVGANIIGAIPLGVAMIIYSVKNGGTMNALEGLNFTAIGMNSTLGLALMIFSFIVGLVLFILLFKPFHQRLFQTVINGTNKIRWRRVITGFLIWGIIMAFYTTVDYFMNIDNYELRLNLNALIPLAIVSLLLIPFQAFYEEILFRGYLAQGVGRITKNRIAVIIIPSIFFALMHGLNPEIEKFGFWNMMPQYFMIAAVYAFISILDDGIELAMGAHAANNAFISIFVTADGTAFQTDALLKVYEISPWKEFVVLIIASAVFIGTLAFKYRWRFKILSMPVEPDVKELKI